MKKTRIFPECCSHSRFVVGTAALLLAGLLLSGCRTDLPPEVAAQTSSESSETTPAVTSDEPAAPVSSEATLNRGKHPEIPYATPMILDYLDLENSSWERTEDAEFIMIHFSSAVVDHPEDPYNMTYIREIFDNSEAGTHYYIERNGTVHAWVPEYRAAWHAGKGAFGDEKYTNAMNKYAIGIEIAAMGTMEEMSLYMTPEQYQALDPSWPGYTDAQYESLRTLISDIAANWDIPLDRQHIIGHDEYAPERKNDPGTLFDWSRILDE